MTELKETSPQIEEEKVENPFQEAIKHSDDTMHDIVIGTTEASCRKCGRKWIHGSKETEEK